MSSLAGTVHFFALLAAPLVLLAAVFGMTAMLCGVAVNLGARMGLPVATPVDAADLRKLRWLTIACLMGAIPAIGVFMPFVDGVAGLVVAIALVAAIFVVALSFVCVKVLPASHGGPLRFPQAVPLSLLIGAGHVAALVAAYYGVVLLLSL